jgi:hypothetical protein
MVSLTILAAFVTHSLLALILDKPIDWDKLIPITIILCVGITCYVLQSSK